MEAAGCRVVQGRFCKGQYTQIRAVEHRCMYKQGVRTLEHQIISTARCSRRSNGLGYIRPVPSHPSHPEIALSVLNSSMEQGQSQLNCP